MSGLRSAVDEILAELPLDNTGHVCACGIDDTDDCACISLRPRLEAIVARHVAAALTEVADSLESRMARNIGGHPFADRDRALREAARIGRAAIPPP